MSVDETSSLIENNLDINTQPAQASTSNPSQTNYSKPTYSQNHESDQSKQDEENKILTTLDEFHSQPEETIERNHLPDQMIEEDHRELEEVEIEYEQDDFINDFQYHLERKKEPILSDPFQRYPSMDDSDMKKPFLSQDNSSGTSDGGTFSSQNVKQGAANHRHDYKLLKNVNPEEIELETMPQGFPYHNIKTLTSLKELYEHRRSNVSMGNQTPPHSSDSLLSPQFEDHRLDSLLLVPQDDEKEFKNTSKLSKLLFKKSNRAKLYYILSMVGALFFWFLPCFSILPLVMVYANYKNSHNQKQRQFSKYAKKSLYFMVMYDIFMFVLLFICIIIGLVVKFKNK